MVSRPRLIERLSEGLHRKLTLISAPAGFGKTTLVSTWVAGLQISDRRVAWLSLDTGDSNPTAFLTYFVAALRTIAANIGEGVLDLLQSPSSPQPPIESILTTLFNEIAALPHNFLLVLDDYHVIDSTAVDQALTFLVEHMPPQVRLVITTREDPQIPLARLRSRGLLTELRVTDLRFTASEAAEFLQAMGLNLSTEDIAALEDRTEGWIAGLQLAAISMQGHEDVPAFIQAFAGDHRYIVDYLVEEVLQRQPESTRNFLLYTSILDRLNGQLCDAVTGQHEGSARLMALERGNFFVVPLDDTRHWYRYHHLFAEVLYARLISEQPDIVSALHQHASKWYEHHGSAADAIRHALAAGDFERAADLVERAVPAMLRSRQEAIVLGWLRALPDQVVHMRPVLSADYAHALLANSELDAVEARLRDAERWIDQSVDTPDIPADMGARPGSQALAAGMIVVDEEAFRRLPGTIALARAGYAFALGDVAGIIKCARRVLDLVPPDDHFSRGAAAAFLGLASWLSGDLEAAHRSYADGMSQLQMAGRTSDAINGAIALADIRIAQGHLHEAMRTYERGLQLATAGFPASARVPAAERQGAKEQTALGESALRGTADMYVGMSELLRERNELDAATQHLLKSKEQGELIGLPQNRYRWHVAMSRIREAQGDLDGAVDLLGEAERLYMSGLAPNVRPIAALRARVWVGQGKLGEALDWTRERRLSVEDDLSYLREFEHITLARLLLARYKSDYGDRADGSLHEVMGLLGRLLHAAEEGERTGSVIEILVLQALAHETQGDISAALGALQQALTLAEPEGYVRLFVDEGMPMAILLEEAAKRWPAHRYVRRLLAAFGATRETGEAGQPAGAEDGTPVKLSVKQGSIEPLSERELEVLRLLRTELTGPEIARELVVSLHTVRTHTSNIYNKLGVDKRRAAVRRAEDLGLF